MASDPAPGPAPRAALLSGWKGALLAGFAGAVIGGGAMMAASGSFVRSYLLSHPEILPEAMERLRAREGSQVVTANRAAIETPYAGAWAGAKDGDVVLVEFFDYACTFCRRSNADVDRLLREDPKLKIVWREWPVLGSDSQAAARASLAAAQAGKFRPFHDALFAAGRPTPDAIAKAQAAAGIAPPASPQAGDGELSKNFQLANALKASGTPTFVVSDRVLQGAVGYDALKAAVAEARTGAARAG
jgi:protein-disulfide isomerase